MSVRTDISPLVGVDGDAFVLIHLVFTEYLLYLPFSINIEHLRAVCGG